MRQLHQRMGPVLIWSPLLLLIVLAISMRVQYRLGYLQLRVQELQVLVPWPG